MIECPIGLVLLDRDPEPLLARAVLEVGALFRSAGSPGRRAGAVAL
jgi:hypothetical protein